MGQVEPDHHCDVVFRGDQLVLSKPAMGGMCEAEEMHLIIQFIEI